MTTPLDIGIRRARAASLASLIALAAVTASASRARAAEAPPTPPGLEGTVWLDAHAPIFAAIHPTDLGDGFALMDLLGGIFPETMRALNRVRDGLGLYAFSAGEFSESGVDPDAIVVASWGVADEADWARKPDAPDAAGKPAKKGRAVFVRHRFVVKTLDGDKLVRAAVAILAGGNVSVASFARAHGDPSLPAWAATADVKALAKKHNVLVLGRARDGALVSIRRVGALALIDYADPWTAAASDAKGDVAALLTKMVATPKETLAAALDKGTRRLLSTEDVSIALVVEPGALGPLLPRASCRKEWMTADSALFDDAAVLLRLHPFQWKLDVAWGLTALGKARLGGVASDDGLVDPRAAAADGIAVGGFLVDGFDAIRGAPRPAVLGGKLEKLAPSLDACGPVAWLAAGARFWPQLAAAELERLTATLNAPVPAKAPAANAPDAGTPPTPSSTPPILPNLRNVAAVLRHLPDAKETWETSTVLLATLPQTAEASVTDALAAQTSGKPETQAFGGRLPTFFDLSAGTGFSEAGLEHIAAGRLSLALTPQAAGLGWYYRLARRPAKFGPQSNIGYLHLNLARLLDTWAEESDQATRAAVRLAASQLGQLGGNLSLDGDFVRLALDLSESQ